VESVSPRRKGIVVTELPYMVGPEKVIARIKEAVGSKKLQGITDVADLTDRKHGPRLVISVKNGYNPEAVLAQLYKHTPLEDSFGINNVSLVDGQPHTLGLRELLDMTAGNLSTHLSKLEGAGYVQQNKTYSGRSPATYLALTPEGRVAFERYVRNLRALLDA